MALVIAFASNLLAAIAAWVLRRHVADADLYAGGLAVICVGAATSTVLRRRVAAGVCVIAGAAGAWAASGGLGYWLVKKAPLYVGAPLAIALIALVFVSEPSEAEVKTRRR